MIGRIVLERGDITRVEADAIVNASNESLTPGGGVSGAIHAAAGPSVAEEGRRVLERRGRALAPGEAEATGAGRLPARHVIHALGPVWHGGGSGESEALASAYRESIRLADELGDDSVAFPSISTGIFGYPLALAAPIAVEAVRGALSRARNVREARFVLFDDVTFAAYESALGDVETREG